MVVALLAFRAARFVAVQYVREQLKTTNIHTWRQLWGDMRIVRRNSWSVGGKVVSAGAVTECLHIFNFLHKVGSFFLTNGEDQLFLSYNWQYT